MKAQKGMALVVILVLIGSMLVGIAGCGQTITGSSGIETRELDFSDFTRINVGSAFEVDITESDSYRVSITLNKNLFDYLDASQNGDTLTIRLEPYHNYIRTTQIATITLPDLHRLELSGAAECDVEGFSAPHSLELELSGASSLEIADMSTEDIDLDISGASKVNGSVTSEDVVFDVSGASRVTLRGSGNDIVIDASGASSIDLEEFMVNNADVSFSGASHGTVNLDGRLDAELSGASHLGYIGEPTMGDIDISGASSLNKK